MRIYQKSRIDLDRVKEIKSERRAGWIPTQSTLAGKVLIGLVAIAAIGGLSAAVIVPLVYASEKASTTRVTTATTTTATTSTTTTSTSTTTTTTTTSTSTTTTTTPRYPISCFSTVTASNYYSAAGTPTQQGDGLVDRPNTSGGTAFNAGNYAPQWVQLELPGFYNITLITALVSQAPSGATRHQILVGASSSSLQVVTDLSSSTSPNQLLSFTYNPVLTNVRFVRLYTLSSPSWIAWLKFTVYDV